MPNEIKIDVFDQAAAEKKFDEIEKNSNKDVTFNKADVAKKMGMKEEDLNLPGDKYTPGVKIIKNIQNTDFRTKVTKAMAELRAEQLTGGNGGLTPEQKTQIDIELGKIDKDDFINNEKSDWMYNATHTKTRGGDKVNTDAQVMNYEISGNKDNKNLGDGGRLKDNAKDQNASSMYFTEEDNTAMYVNGPDATNDPSCLVMSHNGKQSGFRMSKEGLHMSTDQAMNMIIGSCENIKVNGQSAKHVDGAYNLIVDGPINIYAKDNISISTDGDINVTAKGNINFQCNGNFGICAKGNVSIVSKAETALNATGKLSLLTEDSIHAKSNGGCAFGGQGNISMKGGGNVNIDGATVNINGGASEDAQPTKLPDFNVPAAAPTDPVVPKI